MESRARRRAPAADPPAPPPPAPGRASRERPTAARLAERIGQLHHILDSVPVYIAYVDADQRYRFANRGYEVQFRRPRGQIEGKTVREVVGEASYAIMGGYVERALAGESLRYERQIVTADEEQRWIEARYVPDVGAGGQVLGFVALITDITEHMAAADERERLLEREQAALAEAQAAIHARDQFLSIAAHELRTPLTTIKGYVQYLARQLRQPVGDRERLIGLTDHLRRQTSRFERLITDLLDVSRLQQGRLDLHPEPVDLVDLARQALAHCRHLPEHTPRHRLTLAAPESLPGVWDPTRIDQVLMNLLSNALKYSPDGGEVRVAIRQVGEQAEIAIRDDGLGMTPEARASLFRPFARAEAVRQGISGLGLGLYITAQLVEQHRGSLALESEPGRGSTVTIRLPLAPTATG